MKRFCDAVAPAWVSINMGFGIRSRPTTPTLSVKRLAEIGFRRITLARMLPAAAIMGMKRALEIMQESVRSGEVHDRPDLLVGIEEITDLMGYAFINQLENEFSLEEDLQQRYRGEHADYVVRGRH
jgi:2-methylisocitrate lyase-like PEP mutase family enzyme